MAALDDKVIDTSTVVDTEKGRIYIHNRKVEDSKEVVMVKYLLLEFLKFLLMLVL